MTVKAQRRIKNFEKPRLMCASNSGNCWACCQS